jgi:hypothetical protein
LEYKFRRLHLIAAVLLVASVPVARAETSEQVTLNAGFDLGDIKSSYHPIALKRTGDRMATLALAEGTVPADKDFELVWRPKAVTAPQTSLFHETVAGENYWLAMVTPPAIQGDRPPPSHMLERMTALSATLKLSEAVEGQGVGKLWARHKIASLEGKLFGDMSPTEVAKAVEKVALQHHLVSSETSLVAVDRQQSRPDRNGVVTADMSVNLPDGWQFDKVFGPSAPTQQAVLPSPGYKAKAHTGSLYRSLGAAPDALPPPSPAQDVTAFDGAAAQPDPIAPAPEPEASGPAPLPLVVPPVVAPNHLASQIGFFILFLAILSAVTLLVWRYHRRDYASPRRIGRRT